MGRVRVMLERVRRLEQAKVSPWSLLIGTPEEFEAMAEAGMESGTLDRRDVPIVVEAFRRWGRELSGSGSPYS
jgi:hypothetical protein